MTSALKGLQVSIDLDHEIRNITRKQTLNDVHFAVQLIRHAVHHRATAINIQATRSQFVIEHDGESLNASERELLFGVLHATESHRRQRALTQLETDHGIALLALVANEARVEVTSDKSFIAERGVLTRCAATRPQGYRIEFQRTKGRPRRERKEILFYCRTSSIPIRFNGRLLPQSSVEQTMPTAPWLTIGLRTLLGHGAVGLRPGGSTSRTRFYNHGIYFGVRQAVPADKLPIEAAYNGLTTEFEENFHRTLSAARQFIETGREALFQGLPETFPALSPSERDDIRRTLYAIERAHWPDALLRVPLFDSCANEVSLSLDDLEQVGRRTGFIAWVPRALRPVSVGPRAQMPVLGATEVPSLQRLLSFPLRRACGPVLPLAAEPTAASPQHDILPLSACPAAWQPFVRALLSCERSPAILITNQRARSVRRSATKEEVCIPIDDPLLAQGAEYFARHPERIDVIKALLLEKPG